MFRQAKREYSVAKDFRQRWWKVFLRRKAISNGRLKMRFGWGDRKSKMTIEKNNSIFKTLLSLKCTLKTNKQTNEQNRAFEEVHNVIYLRERLSHPPSLTRA